MGWDVAGAPAISPDTTWNFRYDSNIRKRAYEYHYEISMFSRIMRVFDRISEYWMELNCTSMFWAQEQDVHFLLHDCLASFEVNEVNTHATWICWDTVSFSNVTAQCSPDDSTTQSHHSTLQKFKVSRLISKPEDVLARAMSQLVQSGGCTYAFDCKNELRICLFFYVFDLTLRNAGVYLEIYI